MSAEYILVCPTPAGCEPVPYAIADRVGPGRVAPGVSNTPPSTDLSFDFIALDDDIQGELCFGDALCVLDFGDTKRVTIPIRDGALIFPNGAIPFYTDMPLRLSFQLQPAGLSGHWSAQVNGASAALGEPFANGYQANRTACFKEIGTIAVKTSQGSFALRNFSRAMHGMVNHDDRPAQPETTANADGSRTFLVGPTRYYQKPQDCVMLMVDGDTMLVDGDATYPAPIVLPEERNRLTLRGISVNGKQPVVASRNAGNYVTLRGNRHVFDNFEIRGSLDDVIAEYNALGLPIQKGDFAHPTPEQARVRELMIRRVSYRGGYFFHDDNAITNCVIHGFLMGIISPDSHCGSMTISHCDIYDNGIAGGEHNIYVATDGGRYPNARLRVEFCYIHDALAGNGLKTRCGRDEVYYNVFTNNHAQSLELIGAAPTSDERDGKVYFGAAESWRQANPDFDLFTVRADSDIVGNVIIHREGSLVRCGGDGCGDISAHSGSHHATWGKTFGRYRFVNNTFVHTSPGEQYGVRLEFAVESAEFYNNVFCSPNGALLKVVVESDHAPTTLVWASGERCIQGSNNFVQEGMADIPKAWINTLRGPKPTGAELLGTGLPMEKTLATWPDWENTLYTYPPGVPCVCDMATYGPGHAKLCRNRDNAFPNPLMTLDHQAVDPDTLQAAARTDNGAALGAWQAQECTE